MSNETAVAQRPQERVQVQEAKGEIVYTPFAAADPIKLSIAIVKKWLCKPTKSGAICTDSDAMRFMMMCQARRLNPFEGDAHLVGYDGKNGPEFSLITAHQALSKRAEPQPSFKGIDSGVIVSPGWPCRACENGFVTVNSRTQRCEICHGSGVYDEVQGDVVPPEQTLIGGWAHLEREDRRIPIHRRLQLKAYMPSYPNKFWQDNPAGQIVKCAEADVYRSAYPTLVGGLYTDGESGFAMVSRELSSAPPSMLATPQPVKTLAAPQHQPTPQPARKGPTLVEEPLSPDESAEAAMGLAPEQQAEASVKAAAPPAEPTPQEKLAEIVTGAGFTFDHLKAWGQSELESGDPSTGILAWDTYGGFADLPTKLCNFCIKAKAGLLGALKGAAL